MTMTIPLPGPRPTPDEIKQRIEILRNTDFTVLSPTERVVQLAESTVGLGADIEGEIRQMYLNVVCPERVVLGGLREYQHEPDWWSMYGCGLVARSHLRRAGYRAAVLGLLRATSLTVSQGLPGSYQPYATGMAVSDVILFARSRDAWREGAAISPVPGIYVIGTGLATHVRLITHVETSDDGASYVTRSVDGGQTMGSYEIGQSWHPYEGVKLVENEPLVVQNGRWVSSGRVVQGMVDLEALGEPDEAPRADFI